MDINEIRMISPCGVDCGDCAAHLAGSDPVKMEKMLSLGFKKESLPCPGCRPLKGNCPVIGGDCETYACVQKRNVNFCFECPDFPCAKLAPSADKASFAVHNMKLFNLCFIERHGVEAWRAAVTEIKKRYFQGKLVFGKGPQIQSE